jgi:hypothetical protein
LRDKQASDMAGLQKEIVKEDDARRRGDVKAVEEAQKNQKDIQLKMRKLDIDEQVARAQLLSFENRGSNAGLKENPLVTAAAKFFIENPYDPDVKKYKNDLEGYLNSRGLSSSGAAINRNAAPTATPIVTTKAEFDKLPSGAIYTSTDGKQYRKP